MLNLVETLSSHLVEADKLLVHDVFSYLETPEVFFARISEENTLRTYRNILWVIKKSEQPNHSRKLLSFQEVIDLVEKIDKPKLGLALDVLTWTAVIQPVDFSTEIEKQIENFKKDEEKRKDKSLHIILVLVNLLISAENSTNAIKLDGILDLVHDLIFVTDCNETYFIALEILKLFLKENLVQLSKIDFNHSRKDRYLQVLCDLVDFFLPNEENSSQWSDFIEKEDLMSVLLEESQKVGDDLHSKRVFFLLQKITASIQGKFDFNS